jgi:glutamate synthase domain-containing protein 2/glutamate synthase domain-containing protein 3
LVGELADTARLIEVAVPETCAAPRLAGVLQRLHADHPRLLISVYLRYGGDFWTLAYAAARADGVALLHVHSGAERSYRLVPCIDEMLKQARLRSRVQLVSAGGDHDTLPSAAAVYEAVLLGANAGSVTHLAEMSLSPEFADVARGAGTAAAALAAVRAQDPAERVELAVSSLTCWQHSILDFLSCMGIDDVQKTSGNTMAITVTEDWIRDVDALATADFGRLNRDLNARRVAAEPIPADVRSRFRVSSLVHEIVPDVPLVAAARLLAHRNANYHLVNSNRSLTADHLQVIYKMAAGRMPEVEDFFLDSDLGPWSMDGIGVRLERADVEASLAALARDPHALDYINLAVPRGFHRPGAVPARAACVLAADAAAKRVLARFDADATGGFRVDVTSDIGSGSVWLHVTPPGGAAREVVELRAVPPPAAGKRTAAAPAPGLSVRKASADGRVLLKATPQGGHALEGEGIREPVHAGPVHHASISLGAASEDFLLARVEGNAGLSMTSSGEGGPLRLPKDVMAWESLQAASGHFGITGADLRAVRDVEIKINQGAKPGKGGRLAGPKVTPTVSRARNIPVGTDALSPDPKHDIYSIEDMPAEVWLWLQYGLYCGIKITGSTYTRYVAAGMWSNFVVDYLLIDAGVGGSGNYHADSSRVGWPDIFRTILHTHHALVHEPLYDDKTGETHPIRDLNGAPFGAGGGTRLLASGGIRSEMDMLKVLCAGADALLEASIGKAVAFGCNQCGNCHLDCPRGGITTKLELTIQNDRATMRQRFRNWTALNMVKLAVLIDALNRRLGYVSADGQVLDRAELLDDIRKLRGRTDLLVMPQHPAAPAPIAVPSIAELERAANPGAATGGRASAAGGRDAGAAPAPSAAAGPASPPPVVEHDSCRVGSLLVSERVDVSAIWEAARLSHNGGNNRGGGIAFAGFAPERVRRRTCLVFNTIGPDRAETMTRMLAHLDGVRFYDAQGREMSADEVRLRLPEFRIPVRAEWAGDDGWRRTGLRENPGDVTMLFTELRGDALWRYGRRLLDSPRWVQRQLKYGDLATDVLGGALERAVRRDEPFAAPDEDPRIVAFLCDVKEEYFTALAHLLDTRYYRTGGPAPKYADRRRGFVVSMGEDMGAIKVSGWTHLIPVYFDLENMWTGYPGAREAGGVRFVIRGEETWTSRLVAHAWGMHHRYPTNSPAMDAEGRGNPAGAHPFKAYNVLLMHNGEQVGVDSTAPMLTEHAWVHVDESMGEGAEDYEGDSLYARKALTDTEYAAYLVDFTRRVLGLATDDATQIISPITGIDLDAVEPAERRDRYRVLGRNYVHLTPTGPYKFTILETRHGDAGTQVGFRENMDIKFLRPHEIAINWDAAPGGVQAIANGSEAKIADAMLVTLRQQAVLCDAGSDLRFSMRPGGRPGTGETGGVFEAFVGLESGGVTLRNRFGETVAVPRAGAKSDLLRPLQIAVTGARKPVGDEARSRLQAVEAAALAPEARERFVAWTLERVADWTFDEYRTVIEWLLPQMGRKSPQHFEAALAMLTALRTRLHLAPAGGKSLAALQYLADGGFEYDGEPEGGIYRLLTAVPSLWETRAAAPHARIDFATRRDLVPPADVSQALVVDFHGFESEQFGTIEAARFVSEAVKLGWRRFIGYNMRGGPRYIGSNTADAEGRAADGVRIDLYGRQFGDFLGALLEGADIRCYGQGQSHVGMKADRGSIFVLQDILNTGLYAAHGGTLSVWDSGSRFAVAGQNRVCLEDGTTPAQGLKSIHFGSPNEYAFEYLMSGGDNSLHVVMGLEKPDAKGHLQPRPRPYGGKFFMSGAAAGRVYVFDPNRTLEPAQVHGNQAEPVTAAEWDAELGPFVAAEAATRSLPMQVVPGGFRIQLGGAWRDLACGEAFTRYTPIKVPKSVQRQGVSPPALVGMVDEL